MLNEVDQKFLRVAYDEAKAGFDEGGCPIGSVLARGGVNRAELSLLIAFIGTSFFVLAGCDDCALRLPTEISFLDESDLPIGACLRKMRKWVARKYLKNIQIG